MVCMTNLRLKPGVHLDRTRETEQQTVGSNRPAANCQKASEYCQVNFMSTALDCSCVASYVDHRTFLCGRLKPTAQARFLLGKRTTPSLMKGGHRLR